jgi:hypothetical protein
MLQSGAKVLVRRILVVHNVALQQEQPYNNHGERKERRNKRERENRPHRVQPPVLSQYLGPQIMSSNL